jgi:putative phosphoesterase
MLKVALISDTHVPDQIRRLPSRLIERLHGVDLILHAGDLVRLDVLESLRSVARVIAVHGNMDEPTVLRRLPRKRLLTLAGRRVGLIHGNQAPAIERQYSKPGYSYDAPPMGAFYDYLQGELPGAEIIVFGHLHVPVVKHWHGRLLVNPGPVAPNRGRSSFALLKLGGSEVEVAAVELCGEAPALPGLAAKGSTVHSPSSPKASAGTLGSTLCTQVSRDPLSSKAS